MTRAEMLSELRELVNDSEINGQWRESTLLGYLSEGQDKFCEDTGYFKDTSNFSITLEEGVAVYDIPDRLIEVLDIWNGTAKLRKTLVDELIADAEWPPTTVTGVPERWRADQATGTITFSSSPLLADVGTVLTLQVWRYSIYDLAGDGATEGVAAIPEIPSRFQRACIEWAAYKAFNHHDMETQDPVKARDHKEMYRDYVRDGRLALRRIQGAETRVGIAQAYRT